MSSWRHRQGCLRIGHRGAAALEPQNTLHSFQRALDLGVDGIELDVRSTADGQLVVIHSEHLAETTNGVGLVSEHTLAELRRLDAGQGQPIPTLDETLELLKHKTLLVVDLKILGYEKQVIDALLHHRIQDDVLICSLLPESLRRVRQLAPGIATAISYPEDRGGVSKKSYLTPVVTLALTAMRISMPWRIGRMIRNAHADGVMLYFRLVTSSVVAAVHRGGWRIGTWTVDEPSDIIRLRALGVDSITSNRPDLLVKL